MAKLERRTVQLIKQVVIRLIHCMKMVMKIVLIGVMNGGEIGKEEKKRKRDTSQ